MALRVSERSTDVAPTSASLSERGGSALVFLQHIQSSPAPGSSEWDPAPNLSSTHTLARRLLLPCAFGAFEVLAPPALLADAGLSNAHHHIGPAPMASVGTPPITSLVRPHGPHSFAEPTLRGHVTLSPVLYESAVR